MTLYEIGDRVRVVTLSQTGRVISVQTSTELDTLGTTDTVLQVSNLCREAGQRRDEDRSGYGPRTRIALEKERRDNEEALNFDPGRTVDPERIGNEEPTQGGLC